MIAASDQPVVHISTVTNSNNKQLLAALSAFKRGDFPAQTAGRLDGHSRQDYRYLQRCIRINQRLTQELARIGRAVGKEGRI
jgi:hypothetical protein